MLPGCSLTRTTARCVPTVCPRGAGPEITVLESRPFFSSFLPVRLGCCRLTVTAVTSWWYTAAGMRTWNMSRALKKIINFDQQKTDSRNKNKMFKIFKI